MVLDYSVIFFKSFRWGYFMNPDSKKADKAGGWRSIVDCDMILV